MDDKKEGKEIGIKRERKTDRIFYYILSRRNLFLSLFGKAECMYDFRRKSAKENVNVFL